MEKPGNQIPSLREQLVEGTVLDDAISRCGLDPATLDTALADLEKYRDARDQALEILADVKFVEAVKTLAQLMDSEDELIAVKAASKLVDLRSTVYRANKAKAVVKPPVNKLFDDGFDF